MISTAQLTYSGIGIAVFGQQFCLPIPSMLLLMTAGALAGRGDRHLEIFLVLLSGVLGCLVADSVWYWLGRRWGRGVIRLICSFTFDPRNSREKSHRMFERWGLWLLLFAKFLPVLDGVAPPLAGAEGASVAGFLAYDAAGSLLWTTGYVMLGFLFSSQLDHVSGLIDRFGKMLLILIGVPFLGWAGWRLFKIIRMVRHLRLRRITPELLQQRLDSEEKLAVMDLLHHEATEMESPGIPGAVRTDPNQLRDGHKVVVPDGVSIVLYCSSNNELTSARVAQALNKLGFTEVWVLEGGLDAWAYEGRPLTTNLSSPKEVADRLGLIVPTA